MGYILTDSTVAVCPHGGRVRNATGKAEAYLDGHVVWVVDDDYRVEHCPLPKFNCVEVEWSNPAMHVFSSSSAVLTSESIGSCLDRHTIPIGRAELISYQTKHIAS